MSQPVISVAGLGKRYYLTHQERSDTLRDSLTQGVRGLLRRFTSAGTAAPEGEEFWALRDVTFDVRQGDVVGMIGRNGAGKSTLLKILSRITEPTTGRATIRGRVASLLEVGTGFHPELSGRENIYLNGAILGMSRAEITRKFDEIVAFAEVERFLDTQVKHYSSGMYVRLAFSVAAHLEPEILIVDEVLAVGDAQFQKKCLGKMDEVARNFGRTVIFVSHNMDAVMQLCSSAVLLQGGQVAATGKAGEIIHRYLSAHQAQQNYTAPDDKRFGILGVVTQIPGPQSADLVFQIRFATGAPLKLPTLGIVVYSANDMPLFGSNTIYHPWLQEARFGATGEATLTIRNVPLWTGTYHVSFWLSDGSIPIDHLPEAVTLEIVSAHLPANASPAKDIGYVHVRGEWNPRP
ncbi:MAG: ABC transporter ATP-binding protein [Lacunisphaera sp.]|nr:ABC transporter ATP-binding protein [Lacunisphaera sp.]